MARLGLALVVGVLLVFHVAILFRTRLHPFVDIPNHLAVATIARFYDEPTNHFADAYRLGPPWEANQIHLRFCSAPIFPSVEFANRVFHAGYLGFLLLATAWLIRAVDGDLWAAPLAFLYAYNFNAHWGFANFLAGIPAILLLCRLLAVDLEKRTALYRVSIAIALLALFFVHALVALFGVLVFAVVILVTERGAPAACLRRCVAALPCLAVVAHWWFEQRRASGSAGFFASYYLDEYVPTFLGRSQFLANDHLHVQHTAAGLALALLAPIAISWFAYAAGGGFRRRSFSDAPRPQALVVAVLAASALGCGLLLPDRLPGQAFLWERFSVFCYLALIVEGSRAVVSRPWIRPLVVVLLCALHAAVYLDRFSEFERRNRDFTPDIFPSAANGPTLAGLDYDCRFHGDPLYAHFSSYFIVWKQGIAATSVVDYPFGWIHRRPGSDPLPPHLPWLDDEYDRFGHSRLDYLLVCGPIPPDARRLFASFRPLRTSGRWTIYQRMESPGMTHG